MAVPHTSRRPVLIGLLLVLIVASGIALWQVLDDGDESAGSTGHAQADSKPARPARPAVETDPRSPNYNAANVPIVARAQPEALKHFAILRAQPDGVPAKPKRILGGPLYGLNLALARRLHMPFEVPGRLWFAPGENILCIVAYNRPNSRVNLKCAVLDDALKRGVMGNFIQVPGGSTTWKLPAPGRQLIVGIAPDGVRKAHVRTGSVATTVPVVDNLWVVNAPSRENPQVTLEPTPSDQ